MKNYILFLFLIIGYSIPAQEVSKVLDIPFQGIDMADVSFDIENHKDQLLSSIIFSVRKGPDSFYIPAYVSSLDRNGNLNWKTEISPSSQYNAFFPAYESIVIEDSSFVIAFNNRNKRNLRKRKIFYLRLNYHREILDSNSINVEGVYDGLQGIKRYGDNYLTIHDIASDSLYVNQIDINLEVVQEKIISPENQFLRPRMIEGHDNTIVICYREFFDNGYHCYRLLQYNSDFELINTECFFRTRRISFTHTEVVKTNTGYLGVFYKDSIELNRDQKFAEPMRLMKFGKDLNVEWEYLHIKFADRKCYNLERVSDDEYLLTGQTAHFVFWPYQGISSGASWAMLINDSGDILWERIIYDVDSTASHVIGFDGTKRDDGTYAFIGEKGYLPTIDSHRAPDTYFFTLDENGCWNGNCCDIIIITSDSTSECRTPLSTTEENWESPSEISAFPNPARGQITLEYDVQGTKLLKVFDMQGKIHREIELLAPKSTIDLMGMQAGVYIFQVLDSYGKQIDSKKVIVK